MPRWYVTLRDVIATAEVEADTAEQAEVIAIEQGRAEWQYDHGQTHEGSVEIAPADQSWD